MSIFVPKSSTATRYKEVFGAKMRTYEIQVAGSISTQGGRIGVTADNLQVAAFHQLLWDRRLEKSVELVHHRLDDWPADWKIKARNCCSKISRRWSPGG